MEANDGSDHNDTSEYISEEEARTLKRQKRLEMLMNGEEYEDEDVKDEATLEKLYKSLNKTPLDQNCLVCKSKVSGRSISRHLQKCIDNGKESERKFPYFLISAYNKMYRMYIYVPKAATLDKLDELLREEWFDCCGHLSQFEDVISYRRSEEDDNSRIWNQTLDFDSPLSRLHNRLPMETSLCGDVFLRGKKIKYTYDFGTPSECKLEVKHEGVGTCKKVKTLAKNVAPIWPCEFVNCNKTATRVDSSTFGFYCKQHNTDKETSSRLVNSPRAGICGYDSA